VPSGLPISSWTRSSRRCTPEPARKAWCITATEVASICRSVTPERLAEAQIESSVGSVGDSYDNAMAESIIGLYKTEMIWPRGPWKNLDEVEYATLEWVNWYNNQRLLEPIGNIPPIEFEAAYYEQENGQAMAA
jgi:transposase InsO family protein